MQFGCSFQLPVLFQPSVVDESCSEVHSDFPEFPGSWQGLSFGGVEAWMYFKAALILYRGLKQRKDKLLE